MKVENGHNIKVHYVGTLLMELSLTTQGPGQNLDFQVGSPGLISGFSNAVVGMTTGETKTITLGPDDAYGQVNPDVQNVPKTI